MWNLPAAKRIARALEEFEPFWFEDPIRMTSADALAEFAASTHVPICASETLATRCAFRELFERNAVGVAMLDLSWVGGLSEARKIATMAEAYHLPVAPHDCTGPVVYTASVHLSLNATNALIQEIGARVLHRLVPGAGDRAAADRARLRLPDDRSRASAPGCCRTSLKREDATVRRSAAD